MGGLPNVYPGYQPVNVPANKEKFEAAWNAKLSDKVGLTIPKVMDALIEGSVKALYIVGENPMVSDPDVHHVEKALRAAEFLVVQDIFLTPTAQLAHVVLPGASFAEKDGTFSNTERRVQRVRRAISPMGEARADWEIIQDVSNRFGFAMQYESPAEIMEEIAKVTPSYGGINFDRLEGEGILWPCPTVEHPGTPFLHAGKFSRGLGLFHAIEYRPPMEVVDEQYPLWLSTGRVPAQYHTGTMTRLSPTLDREAPEGFLEMNPEDAQEMDVRRGEPVRVISRRGEITARVEVTTRVGKGVVFMPFHYVENNVNLLTNPACDPIAGIPEFKVCAVKVQKAA
jgi:predicted molibdopterin-dependent oxidoreductase YjgC